MKCGASRGDAKNVVLYWYLQCLVAIDLFTKSKKKNVVKMGDVFREACRHHFFIDFSRFWPPFWEGFGRQNRKKHVSERFEKTVKKKELRPTPKELRVSAPDSKPRGVPYKYPPRRPTSSFGAPTSFAGTSKAS